jgi:glycogen debranching enzyme
MATPHTHTPTTIGQGRRRGDVSLLAGDRFTVVDDGGNIFPAPAYGLYAADTRFLSTYVLLINGETLQPLAGWPIKRNVARFHATNGPGTELQQGAFSLLREQRIDAALHDSLVLTNHSLEPLTLEVTLRCGADFLDLFEVRQLDSHQPKFVCSHRWTGNTLTIMCTEDHIGSRTTIAFSSAPQRYGTDAHFRLHLRPRQAWRLSVTITPNAEVPRVERPGIRLRPDQPLWHVPVLETTHATLRAAYEQAMRDLLSLEMVTPRGRRVLAAGLPWFVALFGRDVLLTSYQTLMLGPELAMHALEALADFQANEVDDFRDAEPGKMPHEVRSGRLARSGLLPHTRYYGAVDATLLWLIVLHETYKWTGDLEFVRRVWPAAESALAWIDQYGDMDGDGFVEYKRRSSMGLDNQGWKDSWDGVRFSDGRLAEPPIALVEVQGYVYDAKLRTAELLDALGESQRADRLRQQARQLKDAFDDAFWMPDKQYYALALDAHKRPVDSIASNPGHALWSGIVDGERAPSVVERLMSRELFSGWGIRTLSSDMKGFGPLSYHNGSVWPHDNSLIAAGLARYGYVDEARRVAMSVVEASSGFDYHRLPELYAGFERRPLDLPVPYPTANAPQAWAAGSVIQCLRILLGINPHGDTLVSHRLPGAPEASLRRLRYRGRSLHVDASRP